MKYKNRLIVPTIVTVSLLGISANAEAEQLNNAPAQKQETQEITYNNTEQKLKKAESQEQQGSESQSQPSQTLEDEESTEAPVQNEAPEVTESATVEKQEQSQTPASNKTTTKYTDKQNTESTIQSENEDTLNRETTTETSKSETTPDAQDEEDTVSDDKIEENAETTHKDSTVENNETAEPQNDISKPNAQENQTSADTEISNEKPANDAIADTNNVDTDKKEQLHSETKKENTQNAESKNSLTPSESKKVEQTEARSEDIDGIEDDTEKSSEEEVSSSNEEADTEKTNKTDSEKETDEDIESKNDDSEESTEEAIPSSDEETDEEKTNESDSKEDIDNDTDSKTEDDEKNEDLQTASINSLKLDDAEINQLMAFEAVSSSPVYTDSSFAAKLKSSKNSGLYSPVTSDDSVNGNFLLDETMYIDQQAKFEGDTYYRVHRELDDRMQGWIKKEDLSLFEMWVNNQKKKYQLSNTNGELMNSPWGTEEQSIKSLDSYNTGTPFHAQKSAKIGQLRFAYGKIDNDYGWIQNAHLKDYVGVPIESDASFAAKMKSKNNSGLYSPVTENSGVNADFLNDETLYIDQQAKFEGETYYRVHREYDDRLQGWMKKSDLDLFKMWDERNHDKKYSLSSTDGPLLNSPWGTKAQTVSSLKGYNKGTPFQAQKSVKIGALNYYYGKLGNNYGWVQDKFLGDYISTPVESAASYAARLNSSISSGLYSPVTSDKGVNGNFLKDQTIYIDQKAVYDGETYYRVNRSYGDRMQGWVKEENLNLYKMFSDNSHKKTYELSSRSGHLLSDPWGTKEQSVMKLTNYFTGTAFQAQKSVKIGSLNYYYGKLGSTYGWISDSKLRNYTPVTPSPSPSVKTVRHSQSLTQAVNTQMNLSSKPQAWANGGGWRNATRSEVSRFLNTSHQTSDTWMYTFLDLDRSQNIASSTLNNRLLRGKGTLNNQGSAFLNASKTYGVNEVYLISHAIHETGNGTSTLAQGVRLNSNGNISSNGKKYYNIYGIGAYDYNPVLAGARYAQQMGWDTPAKAIIGGANFISQSYFNRGQTTLYSMRWNPANPGTYQYATDVNWAYATARNLQNYYNQLEIKGRYYTKHIF